MGDAFEIVAVAYKDGVRSDYSRELIHAAQIGTDDMFTITEDGTTITTKSYDGYEYLESSIEYSNNLDYIIRETDENNISSSYTYTGDGTVASVLDGTGEATIYQSNPMGYLALAKQTNGTTEMAINYAYDGDTLTSVTQGNVEYTCHIW